MKNALIVALVLVAGISQARSLEVNHDVRLQAVTTPLINFATPGEKSTVITVNSYGQVMGMQCEEKLNIKLGVGKPVYVNCKNIRAIETLSKIEYRKMNEQIEEARTGEIRFPRPGDLHCMAMPTHTARYTADNGKVILSAGTFPCGSKTYNTSKAAQALEQTLRGYTYKYSQDIAE